MKLLEVSKCKKALIKEVSKYKHECRLHGVKDGTFIEVVSHCFDMVLVVIDNRESVAIPKEIAKHITIVVIQ